MRREARGRLAVLVACAVAQPGIFVFWVGVSCRLVNREIGSFYAQPEGLVRDMLSLSLARSLARSLSRFTTHPSAHW